MRYGRVCSENARGYGETFSIDEPMRTITTVGVGGSGAGGGDWYWMESDDVPKKETITKPEYRVPSMAEINAVPWNGLKAISTFSGCGGSSLGYKMAGFKVLWANEFIPAAQEVYRLNHPTTTLDVRDIREIKPADILESIGLGVGDLDLFDGSPPCASFSMAGKREEHWGQVKKYSDTKQRVDDLFDEYVRLLDGLRPKVFVAENVSGLTRGVAKGFFLEILGKLKRCGYVVKCRLLDAQWLGVPQTRERAIFVGVRSDLGVEPCYPTPLTYRYSVRDAIPWITGLKYSSQGNDAGVPRADRVFDVDAEPMAAVKASSDGGATTRFEVQSGGAPSKFRSADEPSPAIVASRTTELRGDGPPIDQYAIGDEWDKLGQGEQSERYFNLVRADAEAPSPTILAAHGNPTTAGVTHPTEKRKFSILELKRICAFPDDFALTGSYAQQWERLGRAVPPVMMAAIATAIRDGIFSKLRKNGNAC